jgi:Chemotaxis protein; stimulates methylation of MCP proteins
VATLMVNIAQIKIARPPDMLCALGLGSCVGVVLYDEDLKIAGMLHVLLPTPDGTGIGGQDTMTKFADPGILKLQEAVLQAGARKSRLKAKMAGGAAVLTASASGSVGIGQRNGEECLRMLAKMQIPIMGKDLGGTCGRSLYFDPGNNILRVKKLIGGESQL